jgi:opacity protein-like surface antigen
MPNRTSITMLGAICTLIGVAHVESAQAQPLFTGVYVRGDLGWSWAQDAQIVDKNWALDGWIFNSAGTGPGEVNDIGSSYVLGIGVGARLTPTFRTDVVYSYRGGYELSDVDQFGNAFAAEITSSSVMGNIYWDIPLSMSGFAPFVGAGIGWAGNQMKEVVTEDGGLFFLPEGETSGLAWQAMAGVSFNVSPQAAVDVFYRYFDGGHLQTELGEAFDDLGGSAGTYTGMRGDLTAHEIVLSLRWTFGP